MNFKENLKNKLGKPPQFIDKQSNKRALSVEQAVDVWELRREGYSIRQLAEAVSLSYHAVSAYITKVNRAIEFNEELRKRDLI